MEIMMKNLLKDVIIEVLLRLSVKSLLRFRCICKAWCNLIASPDFIASHFNHPIVEDDYHFLIKRCLKDRVTNILSIHSNTESLTTVSPNIKIPDLAHDFSHLIGPCNGLFCISDYTTIILCNPAMREFNLLPARPFGCPPDVMSIGYGVGFGFDTNTNEYKIVRIVDMTDIDDYTFYIVRAELYRCSTGQWEKIDHDLPRVWRADCFEIFFHGACHWNAKREDIQLILSYCFTTEVFQEIDFPKDCPRPFIDGKRKSLTTLYECLAMLSYTDLCYDTNQPVIDVWVMKEYGIVESWIKQCTIAPLADIQLPLTSWKNSSILVENKKGQLISCGLDTQEVKEYNIFGYSTTLRALIYKESLVSIKK